MTFERASGGQDRNTRQLPTVDVAETFDAVQIVAVSGAPVGVDRVVGAQVDHAEGAAGGVEKEPAGVGRVDKGVDEVNGGFGGILGGYHLTLKKKYSQEKQACC